MLFSHFWAYKNQLISTNMFISIIQCLYHTAMVCYMSFELLPMTFWEHACTHNAQVLKHRTYQGNLLSQSKNAKCIRMLIDKTCQFNTYNQWLSLTHANSSYITIKPLSCIVSCIFLNLLSESTWSVIIIISTLIIIILIIILARKKVDAVQLASVYACGYASSEENHWRV